MANTKHAVIELIEELDDTCSLEDIQYHLYVRQKIEQGLNALENGNYYTHEQVKEKLAKWLK